MEIPQQARDDIVDEEHLRLLSIGHYIIGGLTIYAGRCIKRRIHLTLTLVLAFLNVLFIPFGTILGVFTLIVLSRPNVKRLYIE